METRKKRIKVVVSVLALAALVVFSLMVYAGDLEPSAPPGPTMKTLDEIEPRIPIPGSDTPVSVFTISESGTYYLTGNRLCSSTSIQVDADYVTIDLMDYQLIGPGSGTNYGIYMNGRSNVEIRNGTVRNFYRGIYEGDTSGKDHRIINVRAVSNGISGIYLDGSGHLVKDCMASDNGNSATDDVYGIYAFAGSTVTGNKACYNGNLATGNIYGIYAYNASTVTGNTAYYNGYSADTTGMLIHGIYARSGCTVTGNTAYHNGYSAAGHVYGIYAYHGSTVTGNTVYFNGYSADGDVHGIHAFTGCTVIGNTAYYNGHSADGDVHGIYLIGNNLVDQNTAYDNNGTNMNKPISCTFGTNHAPL